MANRSVCFYYRMVAQKWFPLSYRSQASLGQVASPAPPSYPITFVSQSQDEKASLSHPYFFCFFFRIFSRFADKKNVVLPWSVQGAPALLLCMDSVFRRVSAKACNQSSPLSCTFVSINPTPAKKSEGHLRKRIHRSVRRHPPNTTPSVSSMSHTSTIMVSSLHSGSLCLLYITAAVTHAGTIILYLMKTALVVLASSISFQESFQSLPCILWPNRMGFLPCATSSYRYWFPLFISSHF